MIGPVVPLARARALIFILSVSLLVLAGCGSDNTGGTGTSSSGELQVSLSTDPAPPQGGPVNLIVEVKDAQGKSVEGAQVTVGARHTGMTHGGIEGQLVEQGAGRYQASGSFSMSGTWRVKIDVTKAGMASKTETVDLQVR